jgi:AraC-like DNA-binding protein
MDPLSNVLSLLKPQNYLAAGLDAGGDWAIQFPGVQQGIKTGAVVSGGCWLEVEGVSEPMRLETGDCFMLPSANRFRLASDLAVPTIGAAEVFSKARSGGISTINGGGDITLVSSRFVIAGDHANILLQMLSPVVLIRDKSSQAAFRWSVEQMMQELRAPRPGGGLIVQHLAHMILVQALRLHVADGSKNGIGWLFALADKQMSIAIGAMHDDPGHAWTLQELAALVGMSRSSFALKFKETVGVAPMDYLTRWRMSLAGDRLANSRQSVSAIALALSYESESAFSTAFKRVMGCSPRQYSRGQLEAV